MRREKKIRVQVRKELRRMYRALHSDKLHIDVGWLFRDRRLYGLYVGDGDHGQICVDPWKEFAGTIAHEVFHHLEPDASDRSIVAREKRIIRNASPDQLKRLLDLFLMRWRMTLADRRRRMPRCGLCGQQISRPESGRIRAIRSARSVLRRAAKVAGQQHQK